MVERNVTFKVSSKMLKAPLLAVVATAFMLAQAGCAGRGAGCQELYQRSTISALLAGDYDSDTTVGELTRHGDFGIGTFEGLDGEMVILDGVCRQVRADGKVAVMSPDAATPYASVVFFEPGQRIVLDGGSGFEACRKALDAAMPGRNYFHAVKIQGRFKTMKVRSVPRQSKPYPPLAEVTKNQPVFNYENVAGTLVGFRTPDFVGTMGVPGYHFHFISDDGTKGGHLLDFALDGTGSAGIQELREFHLSLPGTASFKGANLSKGTEQELKKAEK